MVIQSASTGEECHASPKLFFSSRGKCYWHIYLCHWSTWDDETGASVSIYTCMHCPQYGLMELQTVPPTDIRPVGENGEPGFVIQAVLCISASLHPSLSITVIRSLGWVGAVTHMRGKPCSHKHTHAAERRLWTTLREPLGAGLSCSEKHCWMFMLWFKNPLPHSITDPFIQTSVHWSSNIFNSMVVFSAWMTV